MIYNIHYDVCALIIACFTVFYMRTKKKIRRSANKVFLVVQASLIFSCIFDILSSYANSYPERFPGTAVDLFNYFFLASHNILPFLFALYGVTIANLYHRKTYVYWVHFSLPMIVAELFILTNPGTHFIFYYDKDGVYTHGPCFLILYIAAFTYIIYSVICIFKYMDALEKSKKMSLLMLIVFGSIAILIQYRYPRFLLELFAEALAFLGILFSIENEDEVVNGLTKVYNRRTFISDCELLFSNHTAFHIMNIKISDFNYYNTEFGVELMNSILPKVTKWLEDLKIGEVYDCENGHFSILYFDDHQDKALQEKILQRFSEEWTRNEIGILFYIQMNLVLVPADTDNIDNLMLIIDTPYYKRQNEILDSNDFGCYTREQEVIQAIERAIEDQTLYVHYQPIWSREKKKITAAEALVRIHDEKLGQISPEEFIPLAERMGLIHAIGEEVFRQVCAFYTMFRLENLGIQYISVNLSVVQCMNQNLPEQFQNILDKYHMPSSHIILELTETAVSQNASMLEETMLKLSDMGFSFSMDDYGTGYSNFSYIVQLPFSIIKLDKSLLWGAEKNENAEIILKHTLNMMKEMKLKSVVEGVETKEQLGMLIENQCDFCQGYYFAKAMDQKSFLKACQKQ